jgi:protein-arginine kinase activator protein McsA
MKCQHCHKREATVHWVGEGGVLDFVHGMYEEWCEICSLEAQLAHAKKHKNDLQILRKRYALQKKKIKTASKKRQKQPSMVR